MTKPAFTSIELMLVLVLLGILIGGLTFFVRLSVLRADLNGQVTELVDLLRLAQSKAESGEGGTSHGVHLDADQYVLFVGSSYSEVDPSNRVKTLPETLSIENTSLNGGGSDIIFSPPYGETNNYGSFELSSSDSGQTRSISITALGLVQY